MKYKCPSCKMRSEDTVEPVEMLTRPLCVFCSGKHTEKELLNWQMDHIKDIDRDDLLTVIKHFYRYVERELNKIEGEVYVIKTRPPGGGQETTEDSGSRVP